MYKQFKKQWSNVSTMPILQIICFFLKQDFQKLINMSKASS